jgi:acyl-CoA oxidase
MAHAFALVFASQNCEQVYQDLKSKQDNGDLSTLAYGHTTTAALKAYATQIASDGAEDCRKLCGGHGYSVLSGLPDIVVTVTPTATLEGENYVMYQQAARYLVKTAAAVRRGQAVDIPMAYLVNGYQQLYPHTSQSDDTQCIAFADPSYDHVDFLSPDTQLSIFRTRAVRLIFDSEMLLQESQTNHGLSENESWNKHMMSLIAAARAHVELYTLQSFVDTLSQSRSSLSPSSHLVLSRLCSLYALSTITTPRTLSPSFLEHTSLTSGHLHKMRNVMDDILDALTPDAIGLTDSWGFTDASLASALGVWDGNVYETLMAWTRQIPINQAVQLEGGVDKLGFQKFTRPILQAKL